GDALAAGDLAALNRFPGGVIGNVDDRFDRVEGLLGKLQHHHPRVSPVEPKPSSPRALSGSAGTSFHPTRVTGAITIWAMAWPRSTVKVSVLRLIRMTPTSPR